MPSRITLPWVAQTGDQVVALRDLNERVNQSTSLLTKQSLSVRLSDTAVSGARRDSAMDLRMAFILEKLV